MQGVKEGIHLLARIVEGEGGARYGLMPQSRQQRLSAMVSRANSYAHTVEKRPSVKGMNRANTEGQDTTLIGGFA